MAIRVRTDSIRRLMGRRHYATQRDLAIALDWNEGRVSKLLSGKLSLGPKTLDALCAALSCQPSDLIEHT